ncbi:MAG: SIMPL domain-containing protein [Anaerolineae bacterium]|nr:SIMPL domain-containing protein [Anaerolineae bacterium]
MNRFVWKLTAAAAGLAVLLVASGVPSQPASAQTPAPTSAAPAGRTITVIGTGTVYTAPDIAYLQVGVEAQNSDLTAALKEVDTKMNAIVTALKAAGIADADIQTVQYSVFRENRPEQPQSSDSTQPQAIYHAVNIARITVRTPGKAGETLNAAVNAGANVINSVEFGVKDTKASETNARKAAMDDARAKAGELATNVGGTLGQVIAIDESNGAQPFPRLAAAQGGMGGGGPALSGGSLQVSVQLVVTFELK